MLDFNSRSQTSAHVNTAIDAALVTANQAAPPRNYLGGSRLGHVCERALQFEFVNAPKDEGADFDGRLLRIFGIGHALKDVAVGLAGTSRFAAIPTTAFDPPHRAASRAVPALSAPDPHLNGRDCAPPCWRYATAVRPSTSLRAGMRGQGVALTAETTCPGRVD
ncbi:hypothetical protein [Roseomonas marmotae]|uniref:Uncharacterized protein n=1 Tax=Roseomonas marmotae TaxID=2768161 RepID=A0ABS3KHU9_9PROT|nr:hypothetical protein [Roseomonas marmotae]MBO1077048.1 hypothetical protein [Roseomonas marmotae]QTI82115.1 hypothetical protein IAI58_22430 [Roseomonas marmotae]